MIFLLLAAGSGSRFGTLKQLAPIGPKFMLQVSLEQIASAHNEGIVMVLGAGYCRVKAALDERVAKAIRRRVVTGYHASWRSGMGGSLKFGLEMVTHYFPGQPVMVGLADQPLLRTSHYNELRRAWEKTLKPVLVSSFQGEFGPPLVVAADCLANFRGVPDATGAKAVIKGFGSDAAFHRLPKAEYDVDRPTDLLKLASQLS